LLLDAVTDYAIYLLDAEGVVSSWNTGAQRFKGYTADEIIGQHFSRFYTEEDRAAGLPARALRIAAEEGRFEAEGWRIRKNGERFWTSVVIDPVFDETGALVGFAKVTRDLTERRNAQLAVDSAREALTQSQKLEAIGRLTGGVAHDFNNLLTVIRSSADLLRRPGLNEEKRQRYVNAIAETADRAAALTGQLLAFARRQPLRPEMFDVAGRVAGLEQIISASLGAPVVLELDIAPDVGAVRADPTQFDTALLNMVVNARDAMPQGGTVRLVARRVSEVPPVRRHAAAKGDFVAIQVRDTGGGIDPEIQSRIFEPFFTTKDVNKGTGLGLSQVYGFAKQSGGEISLESEVGKGAAFTLYLPRMEGGRETPATRTETSVVHHGRRRILLVEDNEAVGRFAEGLLQELGHDTLWVTHGQEALTVLESGRADFDLVFSDVVMPGMSGVELAREIQRRWPDLPVVLTSGYSHVLAEEGGHGFPLLQKPYSIEGLTQALASSR
jgi:PAS domain S-box-containing protein